MSALFLSRLLLDTRNRSIAEALANIHRLHQCVIAAFPKVPGPIKARKAYGVLYRVEELYDPHFGVRLLVQSQTTPDWSHIAERALLRPQDQRGNPAVREIDGLYERVVQGQRLRFRLRASPTKSLSRSGRRVPLLSADAQLDWLARQGQRLGFHLLQAAVAGNEKIYGFKQIDGDSTNAITHHATLFEGILEVVDGAQFQSALWDGVGRGKAYGLGLLSVAGISVTR